MVKSQHEREPDGNFGGRHGENEEEHHLAIRLSPARSRGDKAESGRIEHHLNRHQREDHVAPRQQSG